MKKLFLLLILIISVFNLFAQVHVRGYYRSNGTYVQPHYRSNPDGNPYNNWSYPGNTNPYTGKVATGDPDTYLRSYYNKSSSRTNTSTGYRSNSSPPLPSYSGSTPNNYNANSKPYTTVDTDFDKSLQEYANELLKTQARSRGAFNATGYTGSANPLSQNHNDLLVIQNAINFHDRYNYQERKTLEEALNDSGYDVGVVDGIFDENTIRGIQEFQFQNKLKADGRLGTASVNKLGFRLK